MTLWQTADRLIGKRVRSGGRLLSDAKHRAGANIPADGYSTDVLDKFASFDRVGLPRIPISISPRVRTAGRRFGTITMVRLAR